MGIGNLHWSFQVELEEACQGIALRVRRHKLAAARNNVARVNVNQFAAWRFCVKLIEALLDNGLIIKNEFNRF